tara:strand:- start:444 stop:548 length:105 start_codon:yes stop_codon:yes gene_type:complete
MALNLLMLLQYEKNIIDYPIHLPVVGQLGLYDFV